MATTTTTKKTTTKAKAETAEAPVAPEIPVVKKTVIHINRVPGQKEQEDVIICVNGQRFQIQRGVDVEVPNKVAAAFELWQRECAEAEKIEFDLMYGE